MRPYQRNALSFLIERIWEQEHKGAGLLLDPGLGKTLITIRFLEFLKAMGELKRCLIIAPLRVAHTTWPEELRKWNSPLSFSVVHGSQKLKALNTPADLHILNPEATPWLMKQSVCDFDMLVIDESTKYKNWTAKRTKAMRKLLPSCRRRVILTGTPSPNSVQDLMPQMYLLDDGEALGKTITWFRNRYMRQGGYQNREWLARDGAWEDVQEAIAPMVYRLKAEDYLDLPEKILNKVYVDLPGPVAKAYKKLEDELFMELSSGVDLLASSAGAKYVMCRSVANGGVYETVGEKRVAHHVHSAKLDAAEDIVEELSGKPVLILYQYQHDLDRLRTKWPKAPAINGKTSPKETDKILRQWNAKKIHVLLCQPQSMSHGLNMQAGGNDVIWFGLTDSLETYIQANARIYRSGVSGQVRIHHILARNTVDEAVWGRIQSKDASQAALLEGLKRYRRAA